MKGLITVIVIILLWQTAYMAGLINPYVLPSPGKITLTFYETIMDGSLLINTWASFERVLVGVSIAALSAILLAIMLATNSTLRSFFLPVIELLRPVPPIAWIPLAIMWFGVRNNLSSYFITFISAFFPVFINTFSGIRHIEQIHINAARSLGAKKALLLTDVMIPSALPFIITGLRISIGNGWMAIIAAEMIVSYSGVGLGYMYQLNRDMNNPSYVMANALTIGIVGYVMNGIILKSEKIFIRWKENE